MADEERPRWPLPPNQVMGRNGAKWDKRSKGPLAEWLGTNNWMYVEEPDGTRVCVLISSSQRIGKLNGVHVNTENCEIAQQLVGRGYVVKVQRQLYNPEDNTYEIRHVWLWSELRRVRGTWMEPRARATLAEDVGRLAGLLGVPAPAVAAAAPAAAAPAAAAVGAAEIEELANRLRNVAAV